MQTETATEPSTDTVNTEVPHRVSELQLFVQVDGVETPQYIFKFTEGGIDIRPDVTWEEYQDGLKLFKDAKSKIKIAFSQYVTYGELRFGKEKVDDALTQLEFDLPDLKAAIQIASVPPNIRHPSLTADHYVILGRAELTKPQMVKWAKTAVAQSLSASHLKASIEAGEVVDLTVAKKNTHGLLTLDAVSAEFNMWLNKVKGEEGIRELEVAAQKDILRLLKPMADLHTALTSGPIKQKKPAKPAAKPKKKGSK